MNFRTALHEFLIPARSVYHDRNSLHCLVEFSRDFTFIAPTEKDLDPPHMATFQIEEEEEIDYKRGKYLTLI